VVSKITAKAAINLSPLLLILMIITVNIFSHKYYMMNNSWLVGWGFMVLSAQKGHIMPEKGIYNLL